MKTDLAVGGRFQVCDFALFYYGLLMIAVPWRGQNVALKQIKVEDFQVFDFVLFYRVPGIAEILGIAVDHGPVP